MENELMVMPANVDLEKAKSVAATIRVEDSQAIINYGMGVQTKISGFSDNILAQVRSKDAGRTGEVLTDLMLKVKGVDVESLGAKGGFFQNIFNSAAKFLAKYEKMSVQIDRIVDELEKTRMALSRDIVTLDNFYKKNVEYLGELDVFIAAGIMKVQELREGPLVEIRTKAEQSGDPVDAQAYNDFEQFLHRFEKKIHDLKLSRMIAIQTSPQIRLIQGNDQALVEKIQSSIMTTIPLWKNQVVIAVALDRQNRAADVQKNVSDTTNKLLEANSEALKIGTIKVATEMERGIVSIETLKKTNADLISTIEETIRIQAEGRAAREAAEADLVNLENELKTKLTTKTVGA